MAKIQILNQNKQREPYATITLSKGEAAVLAFIAAETTGRYQFLEDIYAVFGSITSKSVGNMPSIDLGSVTGLHEFYNQLDNMESGSR